MRSCIRPVRLIQSWLRRKRARSQRCSFESPSVAYGSPEHCQSTEHGSTSNRTTSQKIKVRVYPITCPLCKGLVTSERMGGTADVRVRNMGTISCRPRINKTRWEFPASKPIRDFPFFLAMEAPPQPRKKALRLVELARAATSRLAPAGYLVPFLLASRAYASRVHQIYASSRETRRRPHFCARF